MEKNNILAKKSYGFAIRIVRLAQHLNGQKEYILSKQILRSGTSIGALVSESKYAQSKADFLNKLMIALKEANETQYWINLLYDTDYLTDSLYKSFYQDINEIISILVATTKTIKKGNK